MMRRVITRSIFASLALLIHVEPTAGDLVTWEFTGEVGHVNDPTGVLGGGVTAGSLLTGSYTFDTTTPDAEPDDPHSAFYMGTLTQVSGMVGELSFLGPRPSLNYIVILDDLAASDSDQYGVRAHVHMLQLTPNLEIHLFDSTATLFTSDSLPVIPPDLARVDSAQFTIFLESDTTPFAMSGVITSLVPEPATLGLLSAAVILPRLRRGRRSRAHSPEV